MPASRQVLYSSFSPNVVLDQGSPDHGRYKALRKLIIIYNETRNNIKIICISSFFSKN